MKLTATGSTAEVYECGNGLICKLFKPGYPRLYAEHEYANAIAVFNMGIPSPRPREMVNVDGRDGIVFDRVDGVSLSSIIYRAERVEQDRWLESFAAFHRDILSYSGGRLMDYRDFLKELAGSSSPPDDRIGGLTAGNSLLHGDLHPSNIMVKPDGTFVLIDMMNVCRGPAVYDIARTYFLLSNNRYLQRRYLALMGYTVPDIEPYLEIIALLRDKETAAARP